GRILELHSPDGVHECWLRAADNAEASVWFNALHSALAALTLKALRLASALPDPPQLQHIGWLARRHCLQKCSETEGSRTIEIRNFDKANNQANKEKGEKDESKSEANRRGNG
ncbi:unnamed protein product, partial [Heterotrigona itama]